MEDCLGLAEAELDKQLDGSLRASSAGLESLDLNL